MKKLLILVFFLVLLFIPLRNVLAIEDNYILPYPGLMPGNKLYVIKETWDKLIGFLMRGNFTKFKYELAMADKKIVEAKILYEYGQIALGNKALKKYQTHMMVLPKLLAIANKEGKNISEKEELLKRARIKHQQVLLELSKISP